MDSLSNALPSEEHALIARLTTIVEAQRKTIGVLIERVERCDARTGSAMAVFEQNIALEQVVARKTRQYAVQQERLEQTLQELVMTQARLVHAQKLESIGILAAGIAHEINTPTQYVQDNTQFLSDGFSDIVEVLSAADVLAKAAAQCDDPSLVEAAQGFERLCEEADVAFLHEEIPQAISQSLDGLSHIARIVLAMKNFSHPGQAEKEPSDINAALRDAVTVTSNAWKLVAEPQLELAPELPSVWCVIGDIKQVFLNLIVNAAHAIADNNPSGQMGRLIVRSRREGNNAVIEVEDTGCGISPELREQIFDPFFTTKEVGKGTGQGLAISRDIVVHKHDGELDFESKMGEGTVFRVVLPLKPVEGQ